MDGSELSHHHEQPKFITSVLLLVQTNMPLAHNQSSEQGFLSLVDSVGLNILLYVSEGFMLLFPLVIN